ncbi:MAG: hypothetical protein DSM106950_31755 [Stigonema ocellatum SAG 48.90 = DSM 106950]|nr:hypothetical protein [Stigonema ocellatum SAG 48.90 = DSM 106950]
MNTRQIIFSSLVTAVIGTGLGFVMASLAPTQYKGVFYQDLDRKYAIICTVGGLVLGASQEAIRQLKQQSDQEEEAAIASQFEQSKPIIPQLNSDTSPQENRGVGV